MTYKVIPVGSIEIQHGLWLYEYKKIIIGIEGTFRELYSSEGYCFYDKSYEIYRENENGEPYIVPNENVLPSERTYSTYASLAISADVNDFISINNSEVA